MCYLVAGGPMVDHWSQTWVCSQLTIMVTSGHPAHYIVDISDTAATLGLGVGTTKIMMFTETHILSDKELKRLKDHQYSSSCSSLLDPFMQKWWNW